MEFKEEEEGNNNINNELYDGCSNVIIVLFIWFYFGCFVNHSSYTLHIIWYHRVNLCLIWLWQDAHIILYINFIPLRSCTNINHNTDTHTHYLPASSIHQSPSMLYVCVWTCPPLHIQLNTTYTLAHKLFSCFLHPPISLHVVCVCLHLYVCVCPPVHTQLYTTKTLTHINYFSASSVHQSPSMLSLRARVCARCVCMCDACGARACAHAWRYYFNSHLCSCIVRDVDLMSIVYISLFHSSSFLHKHVLCIQSPNSLPGFIYLNPYHILNYDHKFKCKVSNPNRQV